MKPLLFAGLLMAGHFIWAALLPAGFTEERLATGLDPTAMAVAPDGRIFIAEKKGTVRIFRNDSLLALPFLEIEVDNYNERGLSGILLDPYFDQNGFVYLYYTVPNGHFNRIARFQANGDLAVPGSETVLLDLDPMGGAIHNGGAMQFGADGMLYIAVGDGAFGAFASEPDRIHGKILRIRPDGSIPEDNPFFDQSEGKYRAIYALGLRNPFSMAVNPLTGQMLANDVGWEQWEEVNEVAAGAHYGWQGIEGRRRAGQTAPPGYRDPLYAYSHVVGCAIVGAAFYEPAAYQFPELYHGKFFFGDYCNGSIRVLNPSNGQLVRVFATGINRPIALLTAPDGSLYYLSRGGIGGGSEIDNTQSTDGELWKVTYTGSGAPRISAHPTTLTIPRGEDARFFISATGAAPIHYQWLLNGEWVADTGWTELVLPAVTLSQSGYELRCIANNEFGSDTSRAAFLFVTPNQRPQPRISWPPEGYTFAGGDTLRFSGDAFDPETGPLPAEALTWRVDLFHDDHSHPGMLPTSGLFGGEFVTPRLGELSTNIWYRIVLTATDTGGLTKSVFRDVKPRLVRFSIETDPPGYPVNVDGFTVVTPWEGIGVAGMQRTFLAPPSRQIDHGRMVFRHWENGHDQPLHTQFLPETDTRFRASYARLLYANGTGLRGAYFAQQSWMNFDFPLRPRFSRIDPKIDFDWGFDSPAPRLLRDNEFLIRWEGFIVPYETDEITFTTYTDDGVRLWVNDSLLVDKWQFQKATAYRSTIRLEGGRKYPIVMEYFEYLGEALAQLFWSGNRFDQEIVPQSQLFPSQERDAPQWTMGAVFPSPATDYLAVWFFTPEAIMLDWQLFGTSGRVADRRQLALPEGESIHFIDLTGFARGLYIARVADAAGRSAAQKFVKH